MGKKSKRTSLAEEAHCSGSRCQNDEINPTQMIDLGGDNPPYVVPSVRAAATTGCGYEICYRDNRAGRPWMVESADPETGKIERGSVGELTYRLVPIKVTEVPNIPPPRNMVKAGDITCDMGMNKEEMVATLLNGYNVRHYIHKQKQQGGNAFVITIEFDARMIESPKTSKEATVCLTVTLRSDGLGDPFPDCQRRIHLHANFTNVDPQSKENIAAVLVGSTTSDSPWATVKGLMPLGVDFVLNHPYYSRWIDTAKARGKKVEIRLYDCSPILGLRGEAETSDDAITRVVYFIQSAMMVYGRFELCRLPDGYTGKEVDADPRGVVDVMRNLERAGKFVGQPLLVTDEERCIPPRSTMKEEAFRVEFDDLEMDWH